MARGGKKPKGEVAASRKQKRRPLLQRAAFHALKVLIRKYPRAALTAAGAGAGYAVSSVAEDATQSIRAAVGQAKEAVTEAVSPREPSPREPRALSEAEQAEFLKAMTPRQRRAFAALARKSE